MLSPQARFERSTRVAQNELDYMFEVYDRANRQVHRDLRPIRPSKRSPGRSTD